MKRYAPAQFPAQANYERSVCVVAQICEIGGRGGGSLVMQQDITNPELQNANDTNNGL